MATLAVNVGACINGAGENVVNGRVGRCAPANFAAVGVLRGKRQAFAAQPQPDTAHRPELGEARKDTAYRPGDCLIGMQQYLPILLTPNEARGQATPQLTSSRFVANAAFEACADDVQL